MFENLLSSMKALWSEFRFHCGGVFDSEAFASVDFCVVASKFDTVVS